VLRLSLPCCPKPVQDRCQARRSLPTSNGLSFVQIGTEGTWVER
jgi:hypothetical protein